MPNAKPTLVLIPGLLCDETVWQPVIEKFSGRLPIVVADCSMQDSLTQMAKDALAATSGPLYVAGHSMGARVALEMVRLAPERVLKLVLADTGVHPRKPGEESKRQRVIDLANEHGMQALADQWLPPMVYRQHDTALMSVLMQMVLRMNPQLHARQIQALLDRPDATTGLADIVCPVVLIVGRQDAWSPVEQHESMLPHLRDARLEVIEDAGHFAPVEQPEAFVAVMER